MDEEIFNMDVRKFLKRVGITSQREIEKAVREAVASGNLSGDEVLAAKVSLSIDDVSLEVVVEDDIRLA